MLKLACGTVALLFVPAGASAEDFPPGSAHIKAAIVKSLPQIEKGAAGHRAVKSCFACHHQAIPLLALATARSRGFSIDEEELKQQMIHIHDFLDENRTNYTKGRGQGGQEDTAAYALWTLEIGGWKANATTEAVTEYLLLRKSNLDHWQTSSNRPPSEVSPFTTTYLAVRALQTFGSEGQKERIEERVKKAAAWLAKTHAKDTEDRVFRLWGLRRVGADNEQVRAAALELLKHQRTDGGWAQNGDLESDAYATGTALVAIYQAGQLEPSNAAYRRGIGFLLKTQLEDGTWHVHSRSKPFQPYFESGFPHGKDQFISMAATSWATTALALALPEAPTQEQKRQSD